MLTIANSSVSSTGIDTANSTTDWPAWSRRRSRASVGLGLDTGIVSLRELKWRGPEELTALELVRVLDRHPQEVAGAVVDVSTGGCPGDAGGPARRVLVAGRSVIDVLTTRQLLAADVDLGDGGENRYPGT